MQTTTFTWRLILMIREERWNRLSIFLNNVFSRAPSCSKISSGFNMDSSKIVSLYEWPSKSKNTSRWDVYEWNKLRQQIVNILLTRWNFSYIHSTYLFCICTLRVHDFLPRIRQLHHVMIPLDDLLPWKKFVSVSDPRNDAQIPPFPLHKKICFERPINKFIQFCFYFLFSKREWVNTCHENIWKRSPYLIPPAWMRFAPKTHN